MPTKDIKDYLPHFSKKMTEEMEAYVMDEVFLESRYIFVHRDNKGQQHGYCTHCKNEFETEDFEHNKKAICPKCKSICTAKHSGRGRNYLRDEAYFVYYEKSALDKNIILARGIYAGRDYSGDYTKVKTKYRVKTWYIFDTKTHDGGIMFGEPNWISRWEWKGIWFDSETFEQYKSVYSYFHKYSSSGMIYIGTSKDSIKEAVEGTPFSWSGWETYYNICNNSGYGCCGEDLYYKSKDMVKFFDLYSRYPCIEYLIKLGFVELVIGKLEKESTYRTINWRGKNITSVMKMDKHQLKEIKKKKIHVTYLFLSLLQKSESFGWNLTIEEIGEITMIQSKYYTDELEKIFNLDPLSSITSPKKIVNYLKKQLTKFSEHFNAMPRAIVTFRDYIDDCKELKADLTKENTIFPRDLYTAHQNTIKQIKYKEDQELNKKIKKRSKELSEYYFIDKRLLIRPAGSTEELIEEGKALNHCVGGYAARYADGENILLFIRKTAEPDNPYYTVEIIKDKVIQVRGKDNGNPTEDVTKFMKEFEKIKLNKKNTRKKNKLPVLA